MKILILTSDIPYPLNTGGNVAQYVFADYLRNKITLSFIFEITNEQDHQNSDELKKRWPNVQIIDVLNYEKKVRNYQSLFEKWKSNSKHLLKKVIKRSYKPLPSHTVNIFDIALWYLKPKSNIYLNAISQFIQENKPDLVQIEQVPNLTMGSFDFKGIPTVYVHHELQTELLKSAQIYTNSINSYTDYLTELTATLEMNLLQKFDYKIVFSEDDKIKLESRGVSDIYNIPFAFIREPEVLKYSGKDLDRLTFLGGDIHLPNIDAIKWYFENGNNIYASTGLKLHVIGNWSAKNIARFTCDYIVFDGYVESLTKALQGSINVVPLRIGSGIRTKILNCFGLKVPVVSTLIGIEGISAVAGKDYIQFSNAEDLINSIKLLQFEDKKLETLVENAYTMINSHYSIEYLAEKRMCLYNEIMQNTKIIR